MADHVPGSFPGEEQAEAEPSVVHRAEPTGVAAPAATNGGTGDPQTAEGDGMRAPPKSQRRSMPAASTKEEAADAAGGEQEGGGGGDEDEVARLRRQLEEATQESAALKARIERGELVEQSIIKDKETAHHRELSRAMAERNNFQKELRSLQQELELLTADVFEEANKMVSTVQREKEQLRLQSEDLKGIISSREAECSALKGMIQDMEDKSEAGSTVAAGSDIFSGKMTKETMLAMLDAYMDSDAARPGKNDIDATSLVFLVALILRSATTFVHSTQYSEFMQLVRTPAGRTRPADTATSAPAQSASGAEDSAKTGSLMSPMLNNLTLPSPSQSPGGGGGSSGRESVSTVLKENRFVRRCVTEEIYPTIRLDQSSLSYWTRSKVQTAIIEGNLIIEPISSRNVVTQQECTICQEFPRPNQPWQYGFRRNRPDSDVYAVCANCLQRLRAACDFITFLRQVWEGYWASDTQTQASEARNSSDSSPDSRLWEECTRLRLTMALARWGLLPRQV